MSPRARLLAGSAAGLAAAVVTIAAANATWRTVSPDRVIVPVDGSSVTIDGSRALTGATQDGSILLFAITGAAAAVLAPMLGPKPRIGASAFLAVSGVMVAATAAITRGLRLAPDAWSLDPASAAFGPPTMAPLIAAAGGIVMIAAAAWLLTAARSASRLSMPEGPPEQNPRDEGAWE